MEIKVKNHMLPFFWQHGEDEETLRHYMKVIDEANCHAVCVESRPHPDFCGEGWWHDMDIIIDEAQKRDMKVWILDDYHYPTGYCNGAVKTAPNRLRRGSICYKHIANCSGGSILKKNLNKEMRLPKSMKRLLGDVANKNNIPECRFDDNKLMSLQAVERDRGEIVNLEAFVSENKLVWNVLPGNWDVRLVFFTRNAGVHRSYMNMMDEESCRILIDEVYEPHYAHYKEEFGKTIAGFFSDEPELGNGLLYKYENILGTEQDLPWSETLALELQKSLGEEYKSLLYLLWDENGESVQKARVRSVYMECVTRLVQKCFSQQIGDWCRAHNVAYIGHIIEDNNQHARTGSSLGHYFRGLSGQDMAGIDVVGGQIQPMGEDNSVYTRLFDIRTDGEFCHFALGKLGASAAAIEPKKHGNAMCEIFGAYGWQEGVKLEKYLLDHFMVRGINHFVPHAFSPKQYPDPDCPPHFYAGGNNPQYRHFGKLMEYGNRICSLISDGKSDTKVAILYHAEAEWAGKRMLMQKPGRLLAENQIDFHYVPADVFAELENFHTRFENGLCVNDNHYKVLVVPYAQYIPQALAQSIGQCLNAGCHIIFIDALPEAVATGETLPQDLEKCEVKSLNQLVDAIEPYLQEQVQISPASKYMRLLHYRGQQEIYFLVNEQDQPYDGIFVMPESQGTQWFCYDAWENRDYRIIAEPVGRNEYGIHIRMKAFDSCILVKGESPEAMEKLNLNMYQSKLLQRFTQSVCRSIDYPNFSGHKELSELRSYDKQDGKFSGFIRYECVIENQGFHSAVLEITNAYEGVEVFVNEKSLGIQVTAPFYYSLDNILAIGENKLRIEVATTLERERGKSKEAAPTGITGEVRLHYKS